MKMLMKLWLIVSNFFVLSACQTADLIFYEHHLSEKFYKNMDVSNPDFNQLIEKDILLAVAFKAVQHRTIYIGWLGLYAASSGKSITVEKAILKGSGGQQESIINQKVLVYENFNENNLFKKSIELFQVDKETLDKLSGNSGALELKIFYRVEGEEGMKEYTIKRRVETHIVYPT